MSNTSRGILLFCANVFFGTLVDAPAKFLQHNGVPIFTVVFLRYAIALSTLLAILAWRREWPPRSRNVKVNLLRGALLTSSTFANFYAVGHLPLALVVSINFAAPLISCALAPFLLGEHVGPRRWAAVGVGFCGMLLIVRPGSESFQPAMLVSLFNAFVMANYQVFTRRAGFHDAPETGLLWVFAVGLAISGAALPQGFAPPPFGWLWAVALLMGSCGLLAHLVMSHALRLAPASLLAPFGYTQIVWMTLSGIAVFGDWPDHFTLLGAAIIIASGLYVWHRERLRGEFADATIVAD
ncbi:MAG: DMT family transporter [Alphaproteobacteria bacterium]|nr:DMT family transporter [Alphaproteobacteria bacterium]